jgi:uncharacterized membrane protein
MNSLFATIFPNRGAAEDAQRVLEKLGDEGVLKVVASVVVARGQDGEITQHNGRTPGPLGAGLGGVVGGILGLVVGPIGAIAGAAAGSICSESRSATFSCVKSQAKSEQAMPPYLAKL